MSPPRRQKKHKVSRFYPYKSGLEAKVAKAMPAWDYEKRKVPYVTEADYNPDFTIDKNTNVLIEVKGYFRHGSVEAKKYISVKKSNPELEIIFIFTDPSKKAYAQCRKRKDGTILTQAEWCIKNGFLYYTVDRLPPRLVAGTIDTAWITKEKELQRRRYYK